MTYTDPLRGLFDALPDDLKSKQFDPAVMATQVGNLLTGMHELSRDPIRNPTLQAQPTTGTAAPPTSTAAGGVANPVEGDLPAVGGGGGFGVVRDQGHVHAGDDFGVPSGTHAIAAITGTVSMAGNTDPGGYGNQVMIRDENGNEVLYGHLSQIGVAVGDQVSAGQVIGNTGGGANDPGKGNAEGAHLHFEWHVNGQAVDPLPMLAGGASIVAGGPADSPTPLSPEQIVAAQLGNTLDILKRQPPTHDAQPKPAATTKPGATTGADNDPNAIDAFLGATRTHESGGNYQIRNQSGLSDAAGAYQFLGSTWGGYGGYATADQAPPAVQDAKAREMASALFDKYHSWRLVAIAWFGGPGIADVAARGQDPGAPSGQGSYLAYGDTIQRMMSGG
jgi:hypothetical protein